ncbi:MAG: hypothetical protein CME65_05895 [Halobacteriovoraceae bacterium]|nr:hypothetical protein [Halobacteriovoraceae bacterium]
MIYYLYNIFRVVIYPIVRHLLPLVSKKAKARVEFEHNNLLRRPLLERADFAFEVSSEGELEQVYPLIQSLINRHKTIELVYASESVDEKIKALVKKYPQQVRSFILPILGYQPWSKFHNVRLWLTAEHLFLCRYDFFPELIDYGIRKSKTFNLISASLKGQESKNFLAKAYYKWCIKSFDKIVAVSQVEKNKLINDLSVSAKSIEVFDFRILQISNRLQSCEETLDHSWPLWHKFRDILNNRSHEEKKKKLILGSYWSEEFELIKGLSANTILTIVPHQLKKEKIENLKAKMEQENIPFFELTKETDCIDPEFKGVYLINLKGILCELYSLFDIAYVGGGFGSSVHSVLEPYMANCKVFTGPKIHRSSEFDIIRDYDSDSIKSYNDLNAVVEDIKNMETSDTASKHFMRHFEGHIDAIELWLGISQENK